MLNERGGVISNLILIPVGLALMIGFFVLGYAVGRYHARIAPVAKDVVPLPEALARDIPKPEDFTFYKTLTEKGDRTVSIDLKKPQQAGTGQGASAASAPVTQKTASPAARTQNVVPATSVHRTTAAPRHSPKRVAVETPSATSGLRFTLQISSYQDKSMAEGDVRKMKKKGYAAFIVSSDIPNRGLWHRVRIGSFAKRSSAERLQRELRAKAGVSSIIVIE